MTTAPSYADNNSMIMWKYCIILVACVLSSCSEDGTPGPGQPLEVTLRSSALELERSETGCLRFSLSKWNARWNIGRIELTADGNGTLTSGCKVIGWSGPVDGVFAVYISAPDTPEPFDEQASLSIVIGGRQMSSGTFRLKSSAAVNVPLPVIRIEAYAPVADTETWIDGTIEIEGNGAFEDLPLMATKIKGRGNSSWKWEKKPYALKLSSKTEVLGMPRHKRWCLIANYMDRTLMRNRVAHYIASHTSLRWTPRTRYADVYFNGTFLGNYLVVEQIKIDPNRLDIDELSPADTEGDALTGGYLLEMDSYFDEVYKFRSTCSDMPVNVKSPDETIAPEQGRYIQNYFNAADNLLFDKDYRDPSPMFDLTSFVDYWIVNELMGNQEIKHPKSFYVHKPRLGKLTAGPVWDFDYGTLTLADAERWMVKTTNQWYIRLLSSRKVRRLARARWEALYPFLCTVPDYIEAQRSYIEESARRNFAIWPDITIGSEITYPNGDEKFSFDEAVDRLKGTYSIRLAWLDAQIRSW